MKNIKLISWLLVVALAAVAVVVLAWQKFSHSGSEHEDIVLTRAAGPLESGRQPSASAPFAAASDHISKKGVNPESKYIPWNKLTIRASLPDVLKYSATTKNPDEAYLALQVGVGCATVEYLDQQKLSGIVSVRLPSASQETAKAATELMESSRKKLANFCQTFSDPDQAADVSVARKTALSGSANAAALSALPKGVGANGAPQLTPVQTQAAILSLGQPEVYPIAVDRVLASSAITYAPYSELSGPQRSIAQSLAYWDLTGDRDEDSLRNLLSCVDAAVCVNNPGQFINSQEYQNAVEVSRKVVELVRDQNWRQLGIIR